jgi:hypothetical protein
MPGVLISCLFSLRLHPSFVLFNHTSLSFIEIERVSEITSNDTGKAITIIPHDAPELQIISLNKI